MNQQLKWDSVFIFRESGHWDTDGDRGLNSICHLNTKTPILIDGSGLSADELLQQLIASCKRRLQQSLYDLPFPDA